LFLLYHEVSPPCCGFLPTGLLLCMTIQNWRHQVQFVGENTEDFKNNRDFFNHSTNTSTITITIMLYLSNI
jgi:hypothetical protein